MFHPLSSSYYYGTVPSKAGHLGVLLIATVPGTVPLATTQATNGSLLEQLLLLAVSGTRVGVVPGTSSTSSSCTTLLA